MRGVLLRNAAKARITGNTIEGRAPLASGIGINIWRSEDIYAADNAIKGYIDVWSSNTSMSPGSCIQMLNSSAVIENTTAWDCSHSIETLLPSSVVLRDDTFSNISEFSPQTVATAYNSYLGALKGGYPASGAAYVSLVNSTYASIYGRDIYEYEPVVVKVVNSGGQGVAGVEVMITNGLGGVYATPYYNGSDNRTDDSGETPAINLLTRYSDTFGTHTVTNTIYLHRNLTTFTDTFPKTINATTAHTETYTAEIGPWVISGTQTAPSTRRWSNDILVTGTGNLTLGYSTLIMEPPSDGGTGITVMSGGRLTVDHSTITSENGRRYYIYAQSGSNITILDSEVMFCGCDPKDTACTPERYGITIDGMITVHNSTIRGCYYALNLRGGTAANDGNTFENNYAGVRITGDVNAKINGDTLKNNVYGILAESATGNINITYNTFRNNTAAAIYVYDSVPSFMGNDADAGPGAYGYNASRYTVIVNHTTSYVNFSDDRIKGYTNQSGPVALLLTNGAKARLTNCTIEAGYDKESRGIVAENSSLLSNNSTIYGYRTRTVCTTEWWGEDCSTYDQGGDAADLYASNASFSGGASQEEGHGGYMTHTTQEERLSKQITPGYTCQTEP